MGFTKQLDLLLMIALWRKNADVYVVTDRRSILNLGLDLLFSKIKFFYVSSPAHEQDKDRYVRYAEEILQQCNSIDEFKRYSVNGIHYGKNALSTLIRKKRCPTVELRDTKLREHLKEALIDSLRWAEHAENIIKELTPDHVVFVEKGYTPAAELYNECIRNNVDVVQWISAPTPGALILKRYNNENKFAHPLSLGNNTIKKLPQIEPRQLTTVASDILNNYSNGVWFNRQNLNEGKRAQTKYEIYESLGLAPELKTAVIFAHIFYDATFFYGDNLFEDYKQWLVETVKIAIRNEKLNWIVKVHPVNVWRSKQDGMPLEHLERSVLETELGELPRHIRILESDTDILTSSLFYSIDYGITVRGTIGLELPCFGIPTVTAGTGRYNGNGFTLDPQTLEEYETLLLNLHHVKPLSFQEVSSARRYAHACFKLRKLNINSVKLDYGGQPAYVNVGDILAGNQVAPLQEFCDMADFIIESNEEDYLNKLSGDA
jgi:hypothetical protein